jgi:hypothetical protein
MDDYPSNGRIFPAKLTDCLPNLSCQPFSRQPHLIPVAALAAGKLMALGGIQVPHSAIGGRRDQVLDSQPLG